MKQQKCGQTLDSRCQAFSILACTALKVVLRRSLVSVVVSSARRRSLRAFVRVNTGLCPQKFSHLLRAELESLISCSWEPSCRSNDGGTGALAFSPNDQVFRTHFQETLLFCLSNTLHT